MNGSGIPLESHGSDSCTAIRRISIAELFKSSAIQSHARDVFAWQESPDALKKLISSWEKETVEDAATSLDNGATAVLGLRAGPFASWVYRHIVRATGPTNCMLEDCIEYAGRTGRLGETLAGWHVRKKLKRTFDDRHAATNLVLRTSRSNRGQ